MLNLSLTHYATGSIITLLDDKKHVAGLTYSNNIHQYESDSDYKRLVTEHQTYGDNAMMEEFGRIQDKHLDKLRQELKEIKK